MIAIINKDVVGVENPPFGAEILEFGLYPQAIKEGKYWYKCLHCKLWIEGWPNEQEEDSLGPLCGRRGTTYICARCNQEIAFWGMMA